MLDNITKFQSNYQEMIGGMKFAPPQQSAALLKDFRIHDEGPEKILNDLSADKLRHGFDQINIQANNKNLEDEAQMKLKQSAVLAKNGA